MREAELRYGPVWLVMVNTDRGILIPFDAVPEVPVAADFLPLVPYDPHAPFPNAQGADRFVIEWWGNAPGWFGRNSADDEWRAFDSAEQGMASLGVGTFSVQADEIGSTERAA